MALKRFFYPRKGIVTPEAIKAKEVALEQYLKQIKDEIAATGGGQVAGSIYKSSDQGIGAGSDTGVTWDTSFFDVGSVVDLANNGFTVPSAGVYGFGGAIQWKDGIGTEARSILRVGGSDVDGFVFRYLNSPSDFYAIPWGPRLLNLSASDLVTQAIYFQAAGTVRGAASPSTVMSWFTCWKV